MKKQHLSLFAALWLTLIAAPALATQGTPPPPPPPDNTKVNKQGGSTADEQSQSKPDLDLVQKIRQAIIKDKTLSTSAHNCKVITKDGNVTLRGPVDSTKEKTAIENIATKIAGTGKVSNQLTVKPTK